ncbi:putative T7SS-secreted protein [Cellulomonas sp. ICMP 17802]|uniref:putative T7SS-secreted protein n=1 Tax=Cellulomonas sp. ICMP 17802 TaxID=3239199 RepID=UPI00351BB27A
MSLWTLADTRDPARLVPGGVDDVEADADDADAQAATLEALSEDATRSTATPSWSGDAAAGWARRREQLVPAPAAIAAAYRAAATALRAHATVLAWAQGRAGVAVRLWGDDSASCSPVDTRALAVAVLSEARARATASAHTLARVLDDLGDGLPDGQLHADDFFAGVRDWASGLGSAVLANDPMRAAYDPLGYWRHQVDQVRGLGTVGRALADDPGGAVRALADTRTLDDAPGRWWGRLAPDLALTVGSAGAAGVGARSAAVAGRAAVIAERPPLVIEVPGTEPTPYLGLSATDSWAKEWTLGWHLDKHGAQFGVTTAEDYARLGSEFFQRAGLEGLPTRIGDDGVIRIFDPDTNTFGAFDSAGSTITLFKPKSSTYWDRQDGMLLP